MAREGAGPAPPGTNVGSGVPVRLDPPFLASARVLAAGELDTLFAALAARGYETLAPGVRDGVIRLVPASGAAELPAGMHDRQAPGSYALEDGGDGELFGYAVGPDSLKGQLLPPHQSVLRATPDEGGLRIEPAPTEAARVAVVGARPCEVAATTVLERVLIGGAYPDPGAAARRKALFVVALECRRPATTCRCTSFGTGPGLEHGADLVMIELDPPPKRGGDPGAHRFLVRAQSPAGAEVLAALPTSEATRRDADRRRDALGAATRAIAASSNPEVVARGLLGHIEAPGWEEIASRCLSCGNCTMVCPTCFCTEVRDRSDLSGTLERERRWSSCFEVGHSLLTSGPVRRSVAARYRQWATHKLATWQTQFGTTGCVGCGRCVTWCPVGIDLGAEAAALAGTGAASRRGTT